MPVPKPRKGQKQEEFIQSCMANPTMNKDYPENAQRAAICYSQWKRRKKKAKGDEISFEDQVIGDFVVLDE